MPNFSVRMTAIFEAIGHRAAHGRGEYTADLRGGPLDGPVQAVIGKPGVLDWVIGPDWKVHAPARGLIF